MANSIAMANCFLTSRLTAKPSLPFLAAVPPPPIRLSLAVSHPFLTTRKFPHFTSFVAQTSDWAQEDVAGDVIEAEVEESSAEEPSYPEPPEEAKLFVGNLPYDMDSEKLANLFDKAGVVEVAEVIYNRETDQSRGFGFVTMSTVEEAERAVEMLHLYEVAEEDDDDLDLFGEETEEEKKAAEEREAAVKASSKKKESGKSSVLLEVKPWDDETDIKQLEAAVRSVEMPGLLWGASKLVEVGYGIKKLQIKMTIVDDLVSVDTLIEETLTVEPHSEYIQSYDIVAFNKI